MQASQNLTRTIVLETEPPQSQPSSIVILSPLHLKKSNKFYIDQLGKILSGCEGWTDPLSDDLSAWVDRTYLLVTAPGFNWSEDAKKDLIKRIHKLFDKKLMNLFERAPIKNPVLERFWTMDETMDKEWRDCWEIVYPNRPTLSPFDKQEMQPTHPHQFAMVIQCWAEAFLRELDPGSNFNPSLPTEDIFELVPSPPKKIDDVASAKEKMLEYILYAKAAKIKMNGRRIKREMKMGTEEMIQQEKETNERIARQIAHTEEMVLLHQARVEAQYEEMENHYNGREEELVLRLQQEVEKIKQIREETEERLRQAEERAREARQAHEEELETRITGIDQQYQRNEEVLHANLEEKEREIGQVRVETREMLEQTVARSNEEREACREEFVRRIGNIEQNHHLTEEALQRRVEDGTRTIKQVRGQNQELAQEIARERERQRLRQQEYENTLHGITENHRNQTHHLNSQIAHAQQSLRNTNQQINHLHTASTNQTRQINHLKATLAAEHREIHHLKKKAKKKKFGIF